MTTLLSTGRLSGESDRLTPFPAKMFDQHIVEVTAKIGYFNFPDIVGHYMSGSPLKKVALSSTLISEIASCFNDMFPDG